ncbi:MAG: UvrB/UvrC motif-containing protein [Chitinivibrionales bacterium]|nr:UvrB/UvrC motif-containing protein [Chitinivibrionales bacterium]
METDSVLEALILEANYIKKYQPKYNVKEKDDRSWIYFALTREAFPRLEAIRERNLKNLKEKERKKFLYVFGPFAQVKTAQILKILHNLFQVSRCSPNQKKPCFDYQLGHCLGVCANEINPKEYKEKVIKPLVLFLKGKKKSLIKDLERKMKEASRTEDFEEARRLRDQVFSLKKIRDFSLLDKSFLAGPELGGKNLLAERIEAYDISNLGTESKTGSLVAFNSSGPVKSEYKKFKIKTVTGQSDVDCLKEVLNRRAKHRDWPWPQVMLVDGGKPQVNAAKKVLKDNGLAVFVLGIAKGRDRKKDEFVFGSDDKIFIKWAEKNKKLLIKARNEAHRFAIGYQRHLKRKSLLSD